MAVVAKIAALKFKFDVDALPALGPDLAFRLAIGETGLNGFDHVAQIFGDHPKKEHDALFVDREILGAFRIADHPGAMRVRANRNAAGYPASTHSDYSSLSTAFRN